jgi:hypothetical protein
MRSGRRHHGRTAPILRTMEPNGRPRPMAGSMCVMYALLRGRLHDDSRGRRRCAGAWRVPDRRLRANAVRSMRGPGPMRVIARVIPYGARVGRVSGAPFGTYSGHANRSDSRPARDDRRAFGRRRVTGRPKEVALRDCAAAAPGGDASDDEAARHERPRRLACDDEASRSRSPRGAVRCTQRDSDRARVRASGRLAVARWRGGAAAQWPPSAVAQLSAGVAACGGIPLR